MEKRLNRRMPVIWSQHDTEPQIYNSDRLLELSRELSEHVSLVSGLPSVIPVYKELYRRKTDFVSIFNGIDVTAFKEDKSQI